MSARKAAGFAERSDVYERHPDWSKDSYKSHENGSMAFGPKAAERYGKAFGVQTEWLYSGKGPRHSSLKPLGPKIFGRVAAGAEGFFDIDGEPTDRADPPPLQDERLSLRVEGTSMMPRFRPGELVIFGDRYDDPLPLVGREVMAQVCDTDPPMKLLKVLRQGNGPGLFTLVSINPAFADHVDVRLDWALPVEEVRSIG